MPDSELTLYANVEITDEQQLIFSSRVDQLAYFTDHIYRRNVDCSYQRVGDPLTLDIDPTEIYDFNYISFKNVSFENKVIYARVKNTPRYINNEVRSIEYEIDEWQTWYFDITMDECTILREMHDTAQLQAEETNALNLANPALFTPEPLSYADSNINQKIVYAVEDYDLQEDLTRFDLSVNVNYNAAFLRVLASDLPAGRSDGRAGSNALKCKLFVVTSQSYDSITQGFTSVVNYDPALNFPKACYVKSFFLDTQGLQECKDYLDTFVVRNGISNILGMYYLPQIFGDETEASIPMRTFKIVIPHNGKCAKLNRFPYRYIRITDPFGNVKEYHLEHFVDTTLPLNDTMEITFGMFYVFNGNPQIMLVPKNYKISGTYTGTYDGFNFEESMVITQIPQVAFNTDSFLTYLGNEYRGTLEKTSYMSDLSRKNVTGGFLGDLGESFLESGAPKIGNVLTNLGLLGQITKGALGLMGIGIPTVTGFSDAIYQSQNQLDLQKNTEDFYKNNEINVPSILDQQRPSYAANEYHAGTSSSLLQNYLSNKCGFELRVVEPHAVIQNEYEKFFRRYGYNQGRFGIPKVMNYIGTEQGEDPVFYNGRTFIKTENASINGVNITVCRAIEDMFNRGIWFKEIENA